MIYWLVSLPPVVGGTLFGIAAIVTGLVTYAGARIAVGQSTSSEGKDLAINLFRVIATLLVLLLSLTFADVRIEIGAIRSSVQAETALLADIYKDLSIFDSSEANAIQVQLVEYVDAVIVDEWDALRRGEINEKVLIIFRDLETAILNLETTTRLQEELRGRLIDDIDAVSESRTTRLVQINTGTPVFMYVAFLGFLWTSALLSVYRPQDKTVVLIGAYCAFFGVVTYFILALGNHFEGIGEVTPDSFRFLSDYTKRT
jgi:hypothetical protein